MQRMLELIKHEHTLELKPSDELIALAKAGDITFEDAIEWHICNGWSYVPPEDIGALTSGTIISDDGFIDDEGKWQPMNEPWHVYWHEKYCIENPIITWSEGRSVYFVRH